MKPYDNRFANSWPSWFCIWSDMTKNWIMPSCPQHAHISNRLIQYRKIIISDWMKMKRLKECGSREEASHHRLQVEFKIPSVHRTEWVLKTACHVTASTWTRTGLRMAFPSCSHWHLTYASSFHVCTIILPTGTNSWFYFGTSQRQTYLLYVPFTKTHLHDQDVVLVEQQSLINSIIVLKNH